MTSGSRIQAVNRLREGVGIVLVELEASPWLILHNSAISRTWFWSRAEGTSCPHELVADYVTAISSVEDLGKFEEIAKATVPYGWQFWSFGIPAPIADEWGYGGLRTAVRAAVAGE